MTEKETQETGAQVSETVEVDAMLRTPVTILFSDIKGSTAYFEQKGDVEGLAMVERHNTLLFPCIEENGGRLVKTIGDGIMAAFKDPVNAVQAAVTMQDALEEDGRKRTDSERIRIRIGIHTGLGLVRDNDVFGDVVNAASRVQSQSKPDQILVTDSLVTAVHAAGYQVGRLGRAELRGKDEPFDVFAVGWSPSSIQRLIDDLQSRFEKQIQDLKEARNAADEEFNLARKEWRDIRRKLHAEIETLEGGAHTALEKARSQVTDDFQKQAQFKLQSANQARRQSEEDLRSAQERFETERVGYKAQIDSLERRLVEAIERVNNPARISNEIREEVQSRLNQVKEEALTQWETERTRYEDEVKRLKDALSKNPIAEARQLAMERMKGLREDSEAPDLAAAKEHAERERDEMAARAQALEAEVAQTARDVRRDVSRELRHNYDQQLEQARRVKVQLEQELTTVREELSAARKSSTQRIRQLEEAIPDAEEATRVQTEVEIQSEYEAKLDEVERARTSLDRRFQAASDEWRDERNRLLKQLEDLEGDLDKVREMAYKRTSDPTIEELNRLRRQMDQEFQSKAAGWEEEKQALLARIEQLESTPADG